MKHTILVAYHYNLFLGHLTVLVGQWQHPALSNYSRIILYLPSWSALLQALGTHSIQLLTEKGSIAKALFVPGQKGCTSLVLTPQHSVPWPHPTMVAQPSLLPWKKKRAQTLGCISSFCHSFLRHLPQCLAHSKQSSIIIF